MSRPVDVVIDYLKTQQAQGNAHIYLDEEARECLRELYRKSKEPLVSTFPPAEEKEADAAPTPPAELIVKGSSKEERLASIREQASTWPPAISLGSLRNVMVFAKGNPDARVMLIGEAPGYHEEKQQKPFVGPAGKKLSDILVAMGLSREATYISNLVKFRPAIAKQTTNNRKPTPEEMGACVPLVLAEIAVVQPEVIILLGGTSAEGLLNLSGKVGDMREKWHVIANIPTRVTYHPSYLLQSGGSNQVKRALWEDMLAVMEKLELPISEKQRGFFLPK